MRRSLARTSTRRIRRTRRRGFTLMEVLLVLIILVVLGGIVAQNFMGVQEGALKNTAKSQMQLLKKTIKLYQLDVGSPPSALEGLREAPGDVEQGKWNGPYLEEDVPKDPWNNDYHYKVSGTTFELSSNGPDGQAGTDDDISIK